MSRRPVNPSRRLVDSGSLPFVGIIHSKTRSSPLLTIGLVVVLFFANILLFISIFLLFLLLTKKCTESIFEALVHDFLVDGVGRSNVEKGAILLIGFCYHQSGGSRSNIEAVSKVEGGASCTAEIQRAIPILKKAYGDSMRRVLHLGPDTCSVVSKLLKEEDTEAWGVEPYDLEDADASCRSLVRKGIVRAADIKFPLPYRAKSFSLVIVSDALDYLSPRYLNRTLPELARVSADGVVIFSGYPGQQRVKVSELPKFGRPAKLRSSSWWIRFFVQTSLEENEAALKKFEQAATKRSYRPACQVFHLKSYA